MAYYGDYYRGDYYRGDYYRGDPIFGLSLVSGVAKLGVGLAKKIGTAVFSKKAASTGVGIATGVLAEKLVSPSGPPAPMVLPPTGQLPPPSGFTVQPKKGIVGKVQRALPGGATGYEYVKRRRMNVTNVKALRKAIRRAKGFAKLARRVLTFTQARAPKGKAIFKTRKRG